MITHLALENFKAWRKLGPIRLAPITVLFGANSSGKTSIAQSLLLLKQTAESPDRKRVIHFGDRTTLLDVGTYEDVVYRHEADKSMSFSLRWLLPQLLEVIDNRSKTAYEPSELEFTSRVRRLPHSSGRVVVDELSYGLFEDGERRVRVTMKRSERSDYSISAEGYSLVKKVGRVWPLPDPVRFYGFPDEVVAYHDNAGFLADLQLQLERQLGRISYLGPLRGRPERTYTWSGEIPDHVGWSGERAVEAILAASNRSMNFGKGQHYVSFDRLIARWLKNLGMIDSFEVRQIAKNRKEYEVKVRKDSRGCEVVLPEVGFGVSQVLPVVVQCFYALPNSTIIMEQPEIHLHPQIQAGLADLFVAAIRAREQGEERNVQLIVESHSEHFLRRLQRLVSAEVVKPEEVAVFFASEQNGEAIITELRVDEFGRISNWPDEFFGDLAGDVFAQTENMLKRMTESKGQA